MDESGEEVKQDPLKRIRKRSRLPNDKDKDYQNMNEARTIRNKKFFNMSDVT